MKKRQVVVRREVVNINSNSNSNSNSSNEEDDVGYGECLKNHAANSGGYAVDGCREFLAMATQATTGGALTCAACGCHRNFHKRITRKKAAS